MKRIVLVILFSALLLSVPSGLKRITCGFKLGKMRLDVPFRPDWEIPSTLSSEHIHALLNQPYVYLNRGAQCYVFESADQQYVVKLFRYDQPHFLGKKKEGSSQEKIEKLFSACRLAYENAKEETALLYLHLNFTEGELPVMKAKGPIGQRLCLPLDNYRFVLQKKVRPFREALLQTYQSEDQKAFSQMIDSFLTLLMNRIEKGVGNSDPTLSRNFGFLDGKAIEIDFGNFHSNIGSKTEELHRYTRRLRTWLEKHAPEWVSNFDEKVQKCENGLL